MSQLFTRTFGGLTRQYLFRQYVFGCTLGVLALLIQSGSTAGWSPGFTATILLSTLLYPYARFTYESVVGFIVGDNQFWGSAVFMLGLKLAMMLFCFMAAILIAPLGLAYLYFVNRGR